MPVKERQLVGRGNQATPGANPTEMDSEHRLEATRSIKTPWTTLLQRTVGVPLRTDLAPLRHFSGPASPSLPTTSSRRRSLRIGLLQLYPAPSQVIFVSRVSFGRCTDDPVSQHFVWEPLFASAFPSSSLDLQCIIGTVTPRGRKSSPGRD